MKYHNIEAFGFEMLVSDITIDLQKSLSAGCESANGSCAVTYFSIGYNVTG